MTEPLATPEPVDEKTVRALNAQVAVSSMLTYMMLSFATSRQENDGRLWTLSLKESESGPDIPVTIGVANNLLTVMVAIRHGDLDPSELYWKVSGIVPFVRFERHPPLVWLRADMPIDRNPPYILPDTIQVALQTVFTAVVVLLKEYPDDVHPERLPSVPGGLSGQPAVDA